MNENEQQRIADAVNRLRPDWPVASLLSLLRGPKLASRPRRDVAVALAWVACESATRTPARVLEQGPWWQAATAEGGEDSRWRPPKAEDACKHHPGEWRDRCRSCAANEKAGRPPWEGEDDWMARRPTPPARQSLQEARDALRGTTETEGDDVREKAREADRAARRSDETEHDTTTTGSAA
jgi:hypothetical protein